MRACLLNMLHFILSLSVNVRTLSTHLSNSSPSKMQIVNVKNVKPTVQSNQKTIISIAIQLSNQCNKIKYDGNAFKIAKMYLHKKFQVEELWKNFSALFS